MILNNVKAITKPHQLNPEAVVVGEDTGNRLDGYSFDFTYDQVNMDGIVHLIKLGIGFQSI